MCLQTLSLMWSSSQPSNLYDVERTNNRPSAAATLLLRIETIDHLRRQLCFFQSSHTRPKEVIRDPHSRRDFDALQSPHICATETPSRMSSQLSVEYLNSIGWIVARPPCICFSSFHLVALACAACLFVLRKAEVGSSTSAGEVSDLLEHIDIISKTLL